MSHSHSHMKSKRTFTVDVKDIQVPDIAWPTVILFTVTFIAKLVLFYNAFYGNISYFISIPLQAILFFVIFTPLHDSVHMSISKSYRWINLLIGRLSALAFAAPYPAFRYVHLQHHKHTNDPEKDPDYWCGSHPSFLRPLKWMSLDYHYLVPYLKTAKAPAFELFEAVLIFGGINLVLLYFATHGYFKEVLCGFWIPKVIGTAILAYAFDYAPHHPHEVKVGENPYLTTSRITGILNSNEGISLAIPLLNQNLHNIHHLYSQVPFYRYHKLWNKYEKQFLEVGTPQTSLFGK